MKEHEECPCFDCELRDTFNCECPVDVEETPDCSGCEHEGACETYLFKLKYL